MFVKALYIDVYAAITLPYDDVVLCNKWHYLEINLRR